MLQRSGILAWFKKAISHLDKSAETSLLIRPHKITRKFLSLAFSVPFRVILWLSFRPYLSRSFRFEMNHAGILQKVAATSQPSPPRRTEFNRASTTTRPKSLAITASGQSLAGNGDNSHVVHPPSPANAHHTHKHSRSAGQDCLPPSHDEAHPWSLPRPLPPWQTHQS